MPGVPIGTQYDYHEIHLIWLNTILIFVAYLTARNR